VAGLAVEGRPIAVQLKKEVSLRICSGSRMAPDVGQTSLSGCEEFA